MHKNFIWQAFLFVAAAIALWFTITAVYHYYSYKNLNTQTLTSSLQWEVEEKSEEAFVLKAFYQFEFQGKSYPGNTVFEDTPYRNQWAAEEAIKEISNQNLKVWFDPQDPQHSSLQKKFPYKDSVYAIMLWGLILYFFWLGFYVTKFKGIS